MNPADSAVTLDYHRARFVTQLPLAYCYTSAHAWLAPLDATTWRVGLTKFAVHLLGEIVEIGFQAVPGKPVRPGEVLGWIEGFKGLSDILCPVAGHFASLNSRLDAEPELPARDPYGEGWLYRVNGQPGPECVDAHAYAGMLDQTIDRLRASQPGEAAR